MAEINPEGIYQAKSETLIEHYNNLLKAARDVLSSKSVLPVGFPDTTKWSNLKRRLFIFFMPSIIIDTKLKTSGDAVVAMLMWIFWYIYFIFLGVGGTSFVGDASKIPPSYSPISSPDSFQFSKFFALLSLYFFIPALGAIPYWQLVWSIFHRKIYCAEKVVWPIGFVIILFVEITVFLSKGGITLPAIWSYQLSRDFFLYGLFVFIIPLGIIITSSALFIFKSFIYVFDKWRVYFIKSHSTNYSSIVRELVSGSIGVQESSWRLLSLSVSEIRALKEWSRQSLDATEKKTVPLLMTITIVGVLLTLFSTGNVANSIGQSIVNFGKEFNTLDMGFQAIIVLAVFYGIMLLYPMMLAAIAVLLDGYINLFSNLFVQEVIVEVCIVAEHAKSELEKEFAKQNQHPTPWQIFFDGLFSLLKR